VGGLVDLDAVAADAEDRRDETVLALVAEVRELRLRLAAVYDTGTVHELLGEVVLCQRAIRTHREETGEPSSEADRRLWAALRPAVRAEALPES
jgi:hypothetical protein